jgi:pimeloyl-ACP methyl ester carboxylesterase
MVAVEWAAQAPQEVRACILVNSSMGGLSPPWQRLRPASYGALLRCLLPGTPLPDRERLVWSMTSGRAAEASVLADWVAFADSRPVRAANVLRQLLAAARYRPPRRLAVPALVVAARGDRLVSPRCSQALAHAWGLPLVEHPWAGHDLPLDAPEWLAEQVARWYARWFGNWPR